MTDAATIGRLWERMATHSPGAPCIVCPDREPLSYASLSTHAQTVERFLREAGLDRSSRIAAAMPDGPEASVAFLSFSAACAYAPLNPAEQQPFFEAAFHRLEPSAVLVSTESPSQARAAAQSLRIPLIEIHPIPSVPAGLFEMRISGRSAPSDAAAPSPADLALLLPTSGSTGQPKFVMHSHRSILNAARTLARSFRLNSTDLCLNISPLFHSLGLTGGLLMSAVSGGAVIAAPRFHPDLFYEWMDFFEPTWFSAVPSVLESLLAASGRYQHVLDRSRIRFLRTAAAPMNPSAAAELESCFRAPLIHVYGMSEAPPISIQPFECRKRGSVGVAAGLEMVIRNHDGTPVPPGVTGEITVRGAHVAAGYYRDEDATRRAFRDGWFHTGDRGYQDSEGHLFVTGRLHDLINRGGEKVSPQEVESVFQSHCAVLDAIAFPAPHPGLGEEVALAVVPAPNCSVSPVQLQRYATARLAFHKIPRRFLFLDRIPLLPTGKPDRRLLPRLLEHLPAAPPTPFHAPPRTPNERLLADAWVKALGSGNPGIHDSFFDSGGDSLATVTFLAAASEAFHRDTLPLGFLFEAPTIAEMAALLSGDAPFAQPDILPLQPAGSRTPLFLIGAGIEFRHLINLLGPDQPVFSIRVPESDDLAADFSVERVAARCVQALRSFQPRGPYQLSGWCFSGVLAFEMARQLTRRGEQVSFLGLIDARGIFPVRATGLRARWIACQENWIKVRYHMRKMRKLHLRDATAYLSARSQTVARRLLRRLSKSPGSSLPAQLRRDYLTALALDRYQPEPYEGESVHFWAKEAPPSPYRQFPGEWAPYTRGPLTLHEIPGTHITMFQPPHVEALARGFQRHLS
ncbi:MAG: AMP-binding protein [Bryobacterales bacterium]|nr:AMP-binding protein [Bryobacterales bacterium]